MRSGNMLGIFNLPIANDKMHHRFLNQTPGTRLFGNG